MTLKDAEVIRQLLERIAALEKKVAELEQKQPKETLRPKQS